MPANRHGIFTVADDSGNWYRSYDNAATWTTYTGGPPYYEGSVSAIDYTHLQRTGEIRYHTFEYGQPDGTFKVWTVRFSESTRSGSDLWLMENFGFDNKQGMGALAADADFDGVVNLHEYAFGSDPNLHSSANSPVYDLSGERLEVTTFPRTRGELNYSVLVSEDLKNWTELPVTPVNLGALQTVTDTERTTDHSKRFMRLKIETE